MISQLLILVGLVSFGSMNARGTEIMTRSHGRPHHYVPLMEDSSAAETPHLPKGLTIAQFQQALMHHSARVHGAMVRNSPLSRRIVPPPSAEEIPPLPTRPLSVYSRPLPFTQLQDAISFIQHQRPLLKDGTRGLPATFSLAYNLQTTDQAIKEGVGLYDTSLAIIAMVQHGSLSDAKSLLDIYIKGSSGNMELRAFPTRDNRGAFEPFDQNVHYYFDFTRASGQWDPSWSLWDVHTGPNAWLALAVSRYIVAARQNGASEATLKPYLDLGKKLGEAMIRLQDAQAQGGIRFGPKFGASSAASEIYNSVNTENNISAYAALKALAAVTGDGKYTTASTKILQWLEKASVYNPLTGRSQQGLRDEATGLFLTGVTWQNNRWEIQLQTNSEGRPVPMIATDSGGTWTISALGPEVIDVMWGARTAYQIWTSLRNKMGRTIDSGNTMRTAKPQDRLDGMDFSDFYSPNEGLISPEWTGGAIHALQQLEAHYRDGLGRGFISQAEMNALSADAASMRSFVRSSGGAYAVGPGMSGARRGQTGFGWTCAPEMVRAMASIYPVLSEDPLAWARRITN